MKRSFGEAIGMAAADIDSGSVLRIQALAQPQLVIEEFPSSAEISALVSSTRGQCQRCLTGEDDRVVVIVGPCSIHDPKSALDYAQRLKAEADRLKDDILVIMRVYFEKPRTTVGWKGLINDPYLDDSRKINDGLKLGRKVLLDINSLGLPCACEFLDTMTPEYIKDLVSWVAIGARTTEAQSHREMASSLSIPVGFKNGTSGDVDIALDAVQAARNPHSFPAITKLGTAVIMHSKGNEAAHVVLRGGKTGPNFEKPAVDDALAKHAKKGLSVGVIVDCSHANSSKNHRNQPSVLENLCAQIVAGSRISGVMIESNIGEGRQDIPGKAACTDAGVEATPTGLGESPILKAGLLQYGVSVTDACVDWDSTVPMLKNLAKAVQERRSKV